MSKVYISIIFLCCFFLSVNVFGQKSGKIVGTVVDAETGEALIGVNVVLDGTMLGTATDIDGKYSIKNVEPGIYNVVVSYLSYSRQTITDVSVHEDEVVTIEVALLPESEMLDEIVVTADVMLNNEAGLLRERQKSIAFSDAISSQFISRSGSGNAAVAMTKVTGASVVGGKYVYVRGLGDRYSSTHLNGMELPSADPDRKAFQLDLFPSNLIENVTAIKTFTPDKPGNFSGGLVNINTKSFPDKTSFTVSVSGAFNSGATFNSNSLSSAKSSTDWLGFDDGLRDLPSILKDLNSTDIPSSTAARRDPEKAALLDAYTKSFRIHNFSPDTYTPLLDQSYALSYGNKLELFGRDLGVLASLSYSNKNSYYDDGTYATYIVSGKPTIVEELRSDFNLREEKGSNTVDWGGLVSLGYKFTPTNKMVSNIFYSRSAENAASYMKGLWPTQMDEDIYETRVLSYKERELISYQLQGDHYFEKLGNLDISWSLSHAANTQNEPDSRFFSNSIVIDEADGDSSFNIDKNLYDNPSRFFRELEEKNTSGKIDIELPLFSINHNVTKLKVGGFYSTKDRKFRERLFDFDPANIDYDGDPSSFFSEANLGVIDTLGTEENPRYVFGNVVRDLTDTRNQYDGDEDIAAYYGMLEARLLSKIRLIGGVRVENTNMKVKSKEETVPEGSIDENDILPSVGIIYELSDKINIRANYGKTLARPNFREIAPFSSYAFIGANKDKGNPDLSRTLISNYDVRFELFPSPGEIFALSVFYKELDNPIEKVFNIQSHQVTWENVEDGTVYGLEFEARKKINIGGDHQLEPNFNFSLVHSEVDIDSLELALFKNQDPDYDADKTRPLLGQSPYLINLDLTYFNTGNGTSVSLLYNVFGKRLDQVVLGLSPDVYERPMSSLNATFNKPISSHFTLKGSFSNILDSDAVFSAKYRGQEYDFRRYSTGRTFSLGISFNY